jgi:hypothetical protein
VGKVLDCGGGSWTCGEGGSVGLALVLTRGLALFGIGYVICGTTRGYVICGSWQRLRMVGCGVVI